MPRKTKPFIPKEKAQTFQVVHRAHSDSRYYDNEASQYVLLPTDGTKKHLEPEDFEAGGAASQLLDAETRAAETRGRRIAAQQDAEKRKGQLSVGDDSDDSDADDGDSADDNFDTLVPLPSRKKNANAAASPSFSSSSSAASASASSGVPAVSAQQQRSAHAQPPAGTATKDPRRTAYAAAAAAAARDRFADADEDDDDDDDDGDDEDADNDGDGDESDDEDAAMQPVSLARAREAISAMVSSVDDAVVYNLPKDGYDYKKHLRDMGGGFFVPSDASSSFYTQSSRQKGRATQPPQHLAAQPPRVMAMGQGVQILLPNNRREEDELTRDLREVMEALSDSDTEEVVVDGNTLQGGEIPDDFVHLAGGPVSDDEDEALEEDVYDDSEPPQLEGEYENEEHLLRALAAEKRETPDTILDQKFEHMLDAWDDDEVGELDGDDPALRGPADMSEFSQVFDEFLKQNDRVVVKMTKPPAKPHADDDDEAPQLVESNDDHDESDDDGASSSPSSSLDDPREWVAADKADDKWDVESVLSLRTNTENHPGLIVVAAKKQIKLSAKTGIPLARKQQQEQEQEQQQQQQQQQQQKQHERTDDAPKPRRRQPQKPRNKGEARATDETPEQRKARKAAVKEEKRAARTRKKALKETYNQEARRQQHMHSVAPLPLTTSVIKM